VIGSVILDRVIYGNVLEVKHSSVGYFVHESVGVVV
jgi:hypothetical protein